MHIRTTRVTSPMETAIPPSPGRTIIDESIPGSRHTVPLIRRLSHYQRKLIDAL